MCCCGVMHIGHFFICSVMICFCAFWLWICLYVCWLSCLFLYSICVQLLAWYVSMLWSVLDLVMAVLYGSSCLSSPAIHPVSGLVCRVLSSCLWCCVAMYAVMSVSIGLPLWVNP